MGKLTFLYQLPDTWYQLRLHGYPEEQFSPRDDRQLERALESWDADCTRNHLIRDGRDNYRSLDSVSWKYKSESIFHACPDRHRCRVCCWHGWSIGRKRTHHSGGSEIQALIEGLPEYFDPKASFLRNLDIWFDVTFQLHYTSLLQRVSISLPM